MEIYERDAMHFDDSSSIALRYLCMFQHGRCYSSVQLCRSAMPTVSSLLVLLRETHLLLRIRTENLIFRNPRRRNIFVESDL